MKLVTCIIVDDEKIAREVISAHVSKINNVRVTAECKNAFEALNFIRNNHVDLIFLDINMPEISGIAFAKSINSSIKSKRYCKKNGYIPKGIFPHTPCFSFIFRH